MAALIMLARSPSRGRMATLGGLALLVALGLGTGIASLTAAWRTEHAYPRYLHDAEVADLVVNPSVISDRAAQLIAAAPGVRNVTSDVLYVATIDTGEPRTAREIDDGAAVQIRASSDGRYVTQDRPVIHRGRMIESGPEAFVNVELAEELGLEIGDELPITFWESATAESGITESTELIQPLGHETVEVVGIGVLPDEVLVDELYPRWRVLVSPEVAAPFTCTPAHPPDDDSLTLEQLRPMLFPPGCSSSYQYFSLKVTNGDAGVAGTLDWLNQQFTDWSTRLPEALLAVDFRFYLVPAVTSTERERIDRSLEPSVTALRLFGIAAAGSTIVLASLAAIRLARRSRPNARVWCQLGAVRAQRATAIGVPLLAALAMGLAGAAVVGWLGAATGPVASARAIDPEPGRTLPAQTVLPLTTAALVLIGLASAAASVGAARIEPQADRPRPSQAAAAAARTGNVPFALGVRSAVRGVGANALLSAAVAAIVAVLGSVVFSTNLSDVVASPMRFAWPYNAAVITGGGYGDANEEGIAASLDRPEVEAWGIAALGAGVINGEAVPFVADVAGFERLPLPVIDGALPTGPDQVALGARTAEQLGLTVGDTVTVSSSYGTHTGTVSGLVVMPPLGPYLTDRAGLGTGALLTTAFLERTLAASAQRSGVPAEAIAAQLGSFVGIDLADGVDPERFVRSIKDDLTGWDSLGYTPFVHTEPVRPAQIADVAAMRSAPLLLAALVATTMGVGLVLAIGVSVRTRRRELAVLRSLGATGQQLRATLRWQAISIVAVGVAFGVPLGIALGRMTWHAFAEGLGIAPAPTVSLPWTALLVLATFVIGLLASALPGRIAAQISPSAALRSE